MDNRAVKYNIYYRKRLLAETHKLRKANCPTVHILYERPLFVPELRELRKIKIHFKSDERVLGDSDFVHEVLGLASEAMERKYRLRAEGYTFDRIVSIVGEIFDISPSDLKMPGKQLYRVKAKSELICWAVQDLGMPATEVGMRLGMNQSAVSRAAHRGRTIAEELGLSPEKHRNA